MQTRLTVNKTAKCYVGGAFIRSESGRVFAWQDREGKLSFNVPQCSRKDVRQAVEAAVKAAVGWAKKSGYLRGQILYRLAEMMEARAAELREVLQWGGASKSEAEREVSMAVDRVIYYAGWADKYEQVLGSVNAVASAHFNFTVTEPVGVVGVIAPDESPLLALLTLVIPAVVSGNACVALASTEQPYVAIVLGEMLATSDVPGGVVNLLTGYRAELIATFASHEQVRVMVGAANAEEREKLRGGAAESVKRVSLRAVEEGIDWADGRWQSVGTIREGLEFKTVWHPVGA